MKIYDKRLSVWYKRYEPQCIEDLILPSNLKSKLQHYVTSQELPHIGLFSSEPGTGKSSTAKAIIKEVNGEALWINASIDTGIDVLRGKIARFASQSSFDDKIKIVVMDEFDNFGDAGQKAFRGFIDEFGENCRFIFTANYEQKIITPLLERLQSYDYNAFPKEEMLKPIFERLEWILQNENIQYERKDIVLLIGTKYPRIRSMISALQDFSNNGVFNVTEHDLDDSNVYDKIMGFCTINTFQEMVISVNTLNSPDNMYTYLYKNGGKYFSTDKYPQLILTIAKYQHMSSSVRDKNLNLAACLTELINLRK